MNALAATTDESLAIDRINAALRGPATEIFRQVIPDLRARTRRDAYEHIMNNPGLAAACFQEFRAKPELFQSLMVGPDSSPVTRDDQTLSCGKTLAQVITLVVRAVAKRYFRARLGFVRRRAVPQKAKPLGLFAVVFGSFRPPPPPAAPRKEYARADALYQALRSYLLFDWQVTLIPHYATLPVSLVNDLGARILDFRDVEQIEALAKTKKVPGLEPVPDRQQLAVAPARKHETVPSAMPAARSTVRPPPTQHSTILAKIDVLRAICRRFGLGSLFGLDENAMHHLIDAVNGPGRPILATLAQAGIAPPKAVVTAACIARRVGLTRFENLMSSNYAPTFLRDLANQTREQNVNSMESATEIQRATNRILDQLLRDYLKR